MRRNKVSLVNFQHMWHISNVISKNTRLMSGTSFRLGFCMFKTDFARVVSSFLLTLDISLYK